MLYSYTFLFPQKYVVQVSTNKKATEILNPIPKKSGEYNVSFSVRLLLSEVKHQHFDNANTLFGGIIKNILEAENARAPFSMYQEVKKIGLSTFYISVFVLDVSHTSQENVTDSEVLYLHER